MTQVLVSEPTIPPNPSEQDGFTPTSSMKPAGATPPAERRYPKLGDLGQFWEHLDQATDDYDKDMLDALKSNMDNLLIFAALFSAVNSAVLALSVPMLSADSGDETNRLLRLLLEEFHNSTLSPSDPAPLPFTAPHDGVRINQLFSVSLTCSMLAAFGSLLGQQWIASYRRRPPGGFEEERRERQRRLLGAKRWHLEPVLQLVLPILLQLSLIIFMVGMVAYLKSVSPTVALPNTILSWFGTAFFILTILFALSDPHCPFKTPFSEALNFVFGRSIDRIRDLEWVSIGFPRFIFHKTFAPFSWLKERINGWYLREWPEEVLVSHSLRRILATSANTQTLHDVALNVPLIQNRHSLESIYHDDVAISHLYQLYTTQSVQSNDAAAVYSIAICHLVLAAGPPNSERMNGLLQDHELPIILSATRSHISNPQNPTSSLPSSIITVALAYLLPEKDRGILPANDCLAFLRRSIFHTKTPDIPIAALSWILTSSPAFAREPDPRREAFEDHPFSHASEAYCKFYKTSRDNVHRISNAVLCCVAQALEAQKAPGHAARSILETILTSLVDIMDREVEVLQVSSFGAVVDALHPLLNDYELGPTARRLMHAILVQTMPSQGIFGKNRPIEIKLETLGALEEHAKSDDEIDSWLEAYGGRSRSSPETSGARVMAESPYLPGP